MNSYQNNYMNYNQGNYNNMNYNYETVENLNPIVTKDYNYVDRYYLINQPHITECITVYRDHYIKNHTCQTISTQLNQCDYTEVSNCCNNNDF